MVEHVILGISLALNVVLIGSAFALAWEAKQSRYYR